MKRVLFVAVLAFAVAAFAVPNHRTTPNHRARPSSNFATGRAVNQNGIPVSSIDELDQDTLVSYNFETDSTSWTVTNLTAKPDYWHRDTRRAYGGTGLSWAANDTVQFPNGGYVNHTLNYLITPTIDLSTTTNPVLGFKVNVNCEPPAGATAPYSGWDGANVWYSTNGGTNWTVLPMAAANGYAYNVASAYSFGFEFGMGVNIPEWGGSSSGWRTVSVPITAAMRVSTFKLRFAFCSDPGYCTLDNPALYGMLVDSIRLSDGATDYLYNDADTHALPSQLTEQNLSGSSSGNIWHRISDSGVGHTIPHCMWIAESLYSYRSALISPKIYLAPGYSYSWQFNIKDDQRDTNTTSALKDYFEANVRDTRSDSGWVNQFIDFDRAATGGIGWIAYGPGSPVWEYTGSTTFNDSMGLDMWRGDSVQIELVAIGDSLNANGTGTGLFVDDFTIMRSSQADNDAMTSQLSVPYPNSVGFLTRGSVKVTNAGRQDQTAIPLKWSVNGAEFPAETLALASGANSVVTLRQGPLGSNALGWTPTTTGKKNILAYTALATDTSHANDTSSFANALTTYDSINVQPQGVYELGYDSRRLEIFFRYPTGSGPMVKFTPHADSLPGAAWNITGFNIQFNGIQDASTYNMNIKVYTDVNGAPGTLIRTVPIVINSAVSLPNWFTTTIPATTVYGNFFVFIDGQTAADSAHVVGHPNTGLYQLGHFFTYNGTAFVDTNLSAFRIHAIVSVTTDVREVPTANLPGKFELSNAYPNPFNPTTEIKFAVPERSMVKVAVFNTAGQQVSELVNSEMNAGTYRATVNGSQLASGIYFVRMNASGFSASKKIVLVK